MVCLVCMGFRETEIKTLSISLISKSRRDRDVEILKRWSRYRLENETSRRSRDVGIVTTTTYLP